MFAFCMNIYTYLCKFLKSLDWSLKKKKKCRLIPLSIGVDLKFINLSLFGGFFGVHAKGDKYINFKSK